MAKQAVAKKPEVKQIGKVRRRRAAFERVCLSKASKRLFLGSDKTLFKLVMAAESIARRRKSAVVGSD